MFRNEIRESLCRGAARASTVIVLVVSGAAAEGAQAGTLYGMITGSNTLMSAPTPAGGPWTTIGQANVGTNMNGLAYDFDHSIMYAIDPGAKKLFTIDINTGAGTLVGSFGATVNQNASGLEYDTINDTLWGSDPDTNRIFTVSTLTGAVSNGVAVQGFTGIEGLAMDQSAGVMYALADGQDKIIKVNPFTGAAVGLPVSLGAGTWRGLAFDHEQNVLYATDVGGGSKLYKINPLTGAGSLVNAPTNFSMQGLAFVPAPSGSLALLLGVLCPSRRRRS
jgi:hypothetical protein